MNMIRHALLLLLVLSAPAFADEGKMSRGAKRLLDSARRMAKASRFKERQQELLGKKILDRRVDRRFNGHG